MISEGNAEVELNAIIDKDILIEVSHDVYPPGSNKVVNRIDGFLPIGARSPDSGDDVPF